MKLVKQSIIQDNSGFTLLELVIAFGLMAVLVVTVAPIFTKGSDYWRETQSQTELRQNLNSALQIMSRELRQADPNDIKTTNISAIVEFKYDHDDELGSPKYQFSLESESGKGDYLTFSKKGGPPAAITSKSRVNITSVEVDLTGSNKYTISITGEYFINGSGTGEELSVQTRVVPRSTGDLEEWQEKN